MTTIEQRIADGARAQDVLDNEAFSGAFDAIEQELVSAWKSSPARDAAGRESIWTYLHLLHKLRAQLTTTMETGRLAQLDLEHKRNLRERARDGLSSLFGSE